MHPELEALAAAHALPPAVLRDLEAAVARMLEGSYAPTLAGDLTLADPDSADTLAPEGVPEAPPPAPGAIPPRYEDAGQLGVGGMGEVRLVRDRELGRTCAYKAIRSDLAGRPPVVARFVEEAQIGAQLQHANIPPIYDAGRLPDGRPWFTMKEVCGETFGALLRAAHAGVVDDAVLRRLGDVLAKVCDAVGYAHGRGVVHRDLKPDNVMVGGHGEVYVLDWGLAKVVGRPARAIPDDALEPEVATGRSADDSLKTRVGGVLGTAAYMPPEQARGEVDRLDARADVYALGAMLYEVLSGRPPYEGRDAHAVLRQVLAGPPEPPGRARRAPGALQTFTIGLEAEVDEAPGPPLPEELVSLCLRCLAREPADRPANGAEVAAALRSWLEGEGRRAKALEVLGQAEAANAEAAALRARAAALRAEGLARLASIPAWAPEGDKAAGWALEDEATALGRRASRLEQRRETLLWGALTHAPGLPEARASLASVERARHAAAEGARDPDGAAAAEARLREHVDALPAGHPLRPATAAYLAGDGALSLETDPPGAEVALFRYELRNRRLVEVPVAVLGRTPLRAVLLPMGSYLCVLRHPERAEVRYPVFVSRGDHWDGAPPGASGAVPVRLPRVGELGPDDCYVPAGPFWSGGDPEAVATLPRRRLWCDALVVRRFPVTNREYLLFLDARVAAGRGDEALRHQPRERAAGPGTPVLGRGPDGRFVLRPDADGDVWDPDHPVVLVDWHAASAFAAWTAEATGRPWRLLGELEWEKVARGVDGRFYPWGDAFDPSWACTRASHPGRPSPARVGSYPVDASVYGVRGLAGNVEDWCADAFRRDGPPVVGGRVAAPTHLDRDDRTVSRCHRGGGWHGSARLARSGNRSRSLPTDVNPGLGIRLAYRPDEPVG